MLSSGQQNFVKNRVETAWIMVETKPHSFESRQNSSVSEEHDVHESQMSAKEEMHHSVYARVVRSRTEVNKGLTGLTRLPLFRDVSRHL